MAVSTLPWKLASLPADSGSSEDLGACSTTIALSWSPGSASSKAKSASVSSRVVSSSMVRLMSAVTGGSLTGVTRIVAV